MNRQSRRIGDKTAADMVARSGQLPLYQSWVAKVFPGPDASPAVATIFVSKIILLISNKFLLLMLVEAILPIVTAVASGKLRKISHSNESDPLSFKRTAGVYRRE